MSLTITDFINDGLIDMGALRIGQKANADLLAAGWRAGNQMIDAWTIDELMAYAIPAQIFNLTAMLEQYQIGPGQVSPNFSALRPTGITEANCILNTVNPVLRKPMGIIGVEEWSNIRVRAATPGATAPISAYPNVLYYDNNFDPTSGFATINIWPAPVDSYQLEIFTTITLPFTAFASLTTAYIFPPAYERMIRKCLAVEMLPMAAQYIKFSGAMLDRLERQAIEAKAAVQSANAPDAIRHCDPAFLSSGKKGGWVYATGDYGSGLGN